MQSCTQLESRNEAYHLTHQEIKNFVECMRQTRGPEASSLKSGSSKLSHRACAVPQGGALGSCEQEQEGVGRELKPPGRQKGCGLIDTACHSSHLALRCVPGHSSQVLDSAPAEADWS